MSLQKRLSIAALILAVGAVLQGLLHWHLAGGPQEYKELERPLEGFPMEVPGLGSPLASSWRGVESPDLGELRKRLDFQVDGLVFRDYQSDAFGPAVNLYLVYSRSGGNRIHHPEYCVRDAAGLPEIPGTRKTLFLDPVQTHPVDRLCYQRATNKILSIYYWHYTLPAIDLPKGESLLQTIHRTLKRPAPSITVIVATLMSPQDAMRRGLEPGFLIGVDTLLRRNHLPPGTTMASS